MTKFHTQELNNADPILTIALLVGKPKNTLHKCLDSLNTLRDSVPSELVIVMTEDIPGLYDELRNYTDRIFSFKWIGDFSAARNESLRHARGKWFMYLDDDEWFEDTAEIEDFFNSGKYRKYDACWYIQRNYHEAEGITYSDDYVSRMRQIVPNLRFESTIHEYMTPFSDNYCYVHSYVHHYGYVYDNDEVKYKHYYRNITLLKKMLIKEPGNLRWWIHILQEYWSVKEYGKLQDFCKQFFDNFKHVSKELIGQDIASFYLAMMESCYNQYDYQSSIEWGEKALEDGRLYELGRATVYEALARNYIAIEDYENVTEYSKKYFDLYEFMKNREKDIVAQTRFLIDETFERKYYEEVCWFMVKAAMKNRNNNELKKFLYRIEWEDEYLYVSDDEVITDLLKYMAASEYEEWFADIADKIILRNIYTQKVVDIAGEYEYAENTLFDNFARILIQTRSRHYYVEYLRILYDRGDETSFTNVAFSDPELLTLNGTFWKKVQDSHIDYEKVLSAISFDNWQKKVENYCAGTRVETSKYRVSKKFKIFFKKGLSFMI